MTPWLRTALTSAGLAPFLFLAAASPAAAASPSTGSSSTQTSKAAAIATPAPTQSASTTPAPAQASTGRWIGFNDSSAVRGTLTYEETARWHANAGANSTRLVIDWAWLENKNDSYNWGVFDGIYWKSLAQGVRPLIGITGAPRWAWDDSATCSTSVCAFPPAVEHYGDYREMLQRLVRRYPKAVGIEIGNEPNLAWAWAGGVDPARYTSLLKAAYAAIKQVSPAMPVISGGLAPVMGEATSKTSYALKHFLQGMYDNGARGHMDGIGIHPYPYGVDFSGAFRAMAQTKDIRAAAGDDVPLWLTEYGMPTTGPGAFTEQVSGYSIPALHRALLSDPDVKGAYVHNLVDNRGALTGDGYGLLRADKTPKPAFCGVAAVNGSAWKCPAATVKATASAAQAKRWNAQVLLQAAADAARKVHRVKGTYRTVTQKDLNAVNPRLSATPAQPGLAPGTAADPARIGLFPAPSGADGVMICNTSQADRSYCIWTFWRGKLSYGHATGNINSAYHATSRSISTAW